MNEQQQRGPGGRQASKGAAAPNPPSAGLGGNGRKPPLTIKDMLLASKNSLAEAAGKWLDADRLLRIATGSIMKNPKLAACDPTSFVGSVLQCAEWGVYPGTGMLAQAFLLPYNNRKQVNGQWTSVLECQAQLSYQGLLTQVRRAAKGLVEDIEARPVYEGDKFDMAVGFKPRLEHIPDIRADRDPNEEPLLVYAMARFKGVEYPHVEWMTWRKILKRRNSSKSAFDKDGNLAGPWKDWPEEMGKKSVLRDLCKNLPNYQDLEGAVRADDEGDVVDGQVSGRVEPGIAAPARPYEVQTVRRELPESSGVQTLEQLFGSPQERETVPVEEEAFDPNTGELQGELPDEDEQALERLRKADEAAKAAAKAVVPEPQGQLGLDLSAADLADQVIGRMRAIAESPEGTSEQLAKFAGLAGKCPRERQEEIGKLFIALRAQMKGRGK